MQTRTKLNPHRLKMFGGGPLFSKPVCVGQPIIGDLSSLHDCITDVVESGWLSNNGHYVKRLEGCVQSRLEVNHCIAVCNGTTALHLMLLALGMKGEVIVPSFTFIATVHAIVLSGCTPVFCDIRPGDHTLDPSAVEQLIGPHTRAILAVHMWGTPCQTEELFRIAIKYKLELFYDAAHAFGCSNGKRMIGNFGLAEAFSFHATKIFSTGEGGAIVTNDALLAAKLRRMRDFGRSDQGEVVELGTNGKMSELAAALGLVNLERIDHAIWESKKIYLLYRELLASVAGIELYSFNEAETCNYHFVPVRITQRYSRRRDDVMSCLRAENVIVQRYFYPGCHRTQFYSHLRCVGRLPVTESLVEEIILLPTFPSVSVQDVHDIVDFLIILGESNLDLS